MRGRKIIAPKNLPTRPTTDFAKEALFNILRTQFEIEDSKVLDLFAGTGNMSYEFVSRGASSCVSVDENSSCIKFIQKSAKEWNLKQLKIFRSEVFTFLKRTKGPYDIIFADPPYNMERIHEIPDLIFEKELLDPDGLLIIEHAKQISFEEHPNLLFSRKYGNVNFTMFTHLTA